jgi:hypothetical protein
LNYKNTRTHVIVVLRVTKHFTQAAADRLSRQGHCIPILARGFSAGHAQWMIMTSWTAYSTWTPQEPTLFDGHYLRNRSTLDIVVLGYIGIV